MSSADWNTFNTKQSALTFGNLTSGDITVSGGTGKVIGTGTGLTINKGSLTSPDMTITGGSSPVLGSGTALTIKKGNLTESGSSVLILTGGSRSTVKNNTSINVKPASSGQSGYVGHGDWSTFNDKISSQWTANGLNLYYNSGNAGIGTSDPQNNMDIAGNALIGATYSGSSAAPANGLLVEGRAGIGTSAPASSASLDVTSTNTGVLLPRMTGSQRDLIVSPAVGLIIYNTDDKALNVYGGTAWKSMTPTQPFVCGLILTINHLVSGGVAPVNKTVTYGTVTGIPGEASKCWITSNLGADHQAMAVSDATEPSAGWYWRFNRMQGYKYDTARIPNTIWEYQFAENSAWTAAQDPCALELGNGWRIPTKAEWTNVNSATGGNWTDWNGPWNSGLKLHAAGYIYFLDGKLSQRGILGNYWSSVQYTVIQAWYLQFGLNFSNVYTFNYCKWDGKSIRCIKQ